MQKRELSRCLGGWVMAASLFAAELNLSPRRIRSPQPVARYWFRSLLPQQAWPQCALKRRSGVMRQLLVASPVAFSN